MRAASILHPLVAPINEPISTSDNNNSSVRVPYVGDSNSNSSDRSNSSRSSGDTTEMDDNDSSLPAWSRAVSDVAPVYFSQLYVHRDSDVFEFHDLQNRTFAYNDGASLSGYHCLRFFLQSYYGGRSPVVNSSDSGSSSGSSSENSDRTANHVQQQHHHQSPDNSPLTLPFFSQIMATGGHLKSLRAIRDRQADVCCIDCEVLCRLRKTSEQDAELAALLDCVRPIAVPAVVPDLAVLTSASASRDAALSVTDMVAARTIGSCCNVAPGAASAEGLLGPNPAQPVVASTRLSESLRRRITDAFIAVGCQTQPVDSMDSSREICGTDTSGLELKSKSKVLSLLEPMNATAYVPVTPSFYDGIHTAMHSCQGLDILCAAESVFVAEAGGNHCYRPA